MATITKTSSLFDTKTHLSGLIAEVEKDQTTIIITRHGKPVAKLVPYSDEGLAERRSRVLAEMRRAAQEAGISHSHEELTAPIPEEYWGVFAEGPVDTRVADGDNKA